MGTERKMTERDRFTSDYDTIDAGGDTGPCLLAPQTLAAGTHYTPTIDMQGFEKVVFDILGGVANDISASLAITVLQSDTAQPWNLIATNAKVMAGLAGSKFISDSADGDYSYSGYYYYSMNRKWLIEVDVEEMDVDAGFRYLQLRIIVSAEDTWTLGIEAIRSLASYEAVSQTGIDEVVA